MTDDPNPYQSPRRSPGADDRNADPREEPSSPRASVWPDLVAAAATVVLPALGWFFWIFWHIRDKGNDTFFGVSKELDAVLLLVTASLTTLLDVAAVGFLLWRTWTLRRIWTTVVGLPGLAASLFFLGWLAYVFFAGAL